MGERDDEIPKTKLVSFLKSKKKIPLRRFQERKKKRNFSFIYQLSRLLQ